MKAVLSPTQLHRLKEHRYQVEGTPFLEFYIRFFWTWLVEYIPLWVAPNLLTLAGLTINFLMGLLVVIQDPNAAGKASGLSYVGFAVGLLLYQTLDGLDGKQARRTNTCSPLGEFFDHGCDAFSTLIVSMVTVSALGMQVHPYHALAFVVLVECANYAYHWQTYSCGVLHFHMVDVIEAQFGTIAALLASAVGGSAFWSLQLFGTGVSLRVVAIGITMLLTGWNLLLALQIVLTKGSGKNGSTIADTSVLSPAIPLLILVAMAFAYGCFSPSNFLQTHFFLYIFALVLPFAKITICMMIAGMTRTPVGLLDSVMLGPGLALLNLYLGTPLPELYLLTGIAVYNFFDAVNLFAVVSWQMQSFLDVSCFTIPPAPPPPLTN